MAKKAILVISVGILSVLFWVWAKPWIENPSKLSSDYNIWIGPVVMLVLLAAIEGLALLLVNRRPWRWAIATAASLPYFIVFGLSGLYWTVVPIAILLQMYGGHGIHSEADERIKINIRQIVGRGLPNIVTSILIMISFAFYFSPATQAAARQQEIPPSVRGVIVRTISSFAGSEIQNLPPAERQTFLTQATNEVVRQFTSFLKPYFKYLPPILAFGLFLILQGLSFILVWLAGMAALLLFWILKKSGLVRIRVAQKEAEKLEF